VQTFLTSNNFLVLPRDPTEKYQKLLYKTMQKCNLIINKQKIKYLIQKKPSPPPKLKALLKLYKTDILIHPLINNMKALSYKLARHLVKIPSQYITLNNYYKVINLTRLDSDLGKLKIHENHELIML
jgi:hypothetical protein